MTPPPFELFPKKRRFSLGMASLTLHMVLSPPLCVREEGDELAVEGQLEGGVRVPPLHTALQVVAGKGGL